MIYNTKKDSQYTKHIRIKEKQLNWLKKNRTTKTTAGYLNKLINEKKRRLGKAKKPDPLGKEINKIISLYTAINPVIDFGHYANRGAVKRLIKKFGYDNAYTMTEKVVQIQGRKYAPVVDTPTKMNNKLGALKVYFKRNSRDKIQSI